MIFKNFIKDPKTNIKNFFAYKLETHINDFELHAKETEIIIYLDNVSYYELKTMEENNIRFYNITPVDNQLSIDIDYYDIMNNEVDENTIKFCYDTDYVIPKF